MDRFRLGDVGCWADGAYGHSHVRAKLAGLVARYGNAGREVSALLRGRPSDDFSEEADAIAILQDHTDEGLVWEMVDGDLCLLSESHY